MADTQASAAGLTADWVARALEGATPGSPLLVEYRAAPGPPPLFRGGAIDSRRVAPGELFFALPGGRTDGHRFLGDARAAGALGLVVRADWGGEPPAGAAVYRVRDVQAALQALARTWRAAWPGRVAGVTGSVGKTTTKELLASVLAQGWSILKSEGNFNNELGLPLTLLRLQIEHAWAVLEMGMEALGEIAALAALARPSVGVVTNVGMTHLEKLGTIENIQRAKSELVEALPPEGLAVLNADDPRVMAMARLARCPVLTYGETEGADVRLTGYEPRGAAGSSFCFVWRGREVPARLSLLGRHAVQNALAAAAVGLGVGLAPEAVVAGLASCRARLRMVVRPGRGGSLILDDAYNAAPASVIAALRSLPELGGRRCVAVLGDMLELGSYEEQGHREVGRAAAHYAQRVVAVGRLGRLIGEEAAAAGAEVVFAPDNAAAVAALADVGAGDIVLVKGSRGAHMEEIVRALEAA